MSDRVDGVIKRIQAIQADYWRKASVGENVEPADVLIVSHGYFSRCRLYIAARILDLIQISRFCQSLD